MSGTAKAFLIGINVEVQNERIYKIPLLSQELTEHVWVTSNADWVNVFAE